MSGWAVTTSYRRAMSWASAWEYVPESRIIHSAAQLLGGSGVVAAPLVRVPASGHPAVAKAIAITTLSSVRARADFTWFLRRNPERVVRGHRARCGQDIHDSAPVSSGTDPSGSGPP